MAAYPAIARDRQVVPSTGDAAAFGLLASLALRAVARVLRDERCLFERERRLERYDRDAGAAAGPAFAARTAATTRSAAASPA
jgi:hypothetical protein